MRGLVSINNEALVRPVFHDKLHNKLNHQHFLYGLFSCFWCKKDTK